MLQEITHETLFSLTFIPKVNIEPTLNLLNAEEFRWPN